jgi:hypothetical protein
MNAHLKRESLKQTESRRDSSSIAADEICGGENQDTGTLKGLNRKSEECSMAGHQLRKVRR